MRRVYFCDRLYSEEELPIEFKLFVPSSKSVKKPYQAPKPKQKRVSKVEKIDEEEGEDEEEQKEMIE